MSINKKNKILLINFGGLGDQILFFPAIKAIKDAYPESSITFATEPRSSSVGKLTNLIDETIICDIKSGNIFKNIIDFLFKVWPQKFDIVVSSGSSKQVAILLFLTGIKIKIGYYSGNLSKLLLSKTISLKKQQYAGNMYHDLAKALNPEAIADIPEINVPDEALEKYRKIIIAPDKKTVVIHPGVSKLSVQKNILKFWSIENWTELVKKLLETGTYKVILTGGPDDKEVSTGIKAALGELISENLLDLTEKTANVIELAAIIKLADKLVCVDSAPMHIGVGVKTPTVALFGPTDEAKLFPFYDPKFSVVAAENLECRPCLWDKRQFSCKNPICLDISVNRVFAAVESDFKN